MEAKGEATEEADEAGPEPAEAEDPGEAVTQTATRPPTTTRRTGDQDTPLTPPTSAVTAITDMVAMLGTVWRQRPAHGCQGSPPNEVLTNLEKTKIRQAILTFFQDYRQ